MDDHDRPLNKRGRRDAPRMGEYLHAHKWEPARVLCSTAARTRQTWNLIAPALSVQPEVHFEKALYLAACPALLSTVRKTQPAVSSLMMIGHNPGLEQLAQKLASPGVSASEQDRVEALRVKFPTCALAVLEFGCDWREVAPGSGRLAAFVRPKDIEDA